MSLGQGPGAFIFSTHRMCTQAWSWEKVILFLLTFDYLFDCKTANMSMVVFRIKYDKTCKILTTIQQSCISSPTRPTDHEVSIQ